MKKEGVAPRWESVRIVTELDTYQRDDVRPPQAPSFPPHRLPQGAYRLGRRACMSTQTSLSQHQLCPSGSPWVPRGYIPRHRSAAAAAAAASDNQRAICKIIKSPQQI
ncbi:hypothetical protein NL676_037711 [Syzygium grande]|nr:hypothetical protein NL676_037711 [Syzygium grande]